MRSVLRTFSTILSLVTAGLISACGATATPDAQPGGDTMAGDTVAGDTVAGDAVSGDEAAASTMPKSGEYYLAVQALPFSNLKLFFKATIAVEGRKFTSFELRAVSAIDGWISDPLQTVKNIDVASDGTFKIVFENFPMPGKATPTGSDVGLVGLELHGTVNAGSMFCGTVEGLVPDFTVDLKGSMFRAVPWGSEKSPGESSCEGDKIVLYKHIDTCPVIAPGEVTITSAERTRNFTLLLPAEATATANPLPVVFLFHGVGGEPSGILKESGFGDQLKQHNFILIVPKSDRKPDGKAKSKTDWTYGNSQFDLDNPDLVLFDDALKCVGDKYKIDPKRIYVTGMSGGGLMSTFTSVHRSKVVAAAAPFSGGYLLKWPSPAEKYPIMVTWGGAIDEAYSQNFDKLAAALRGYLLKDGHFVVACNHGTGHKWPAAMTDATWAFLSSFTLGGTENPLKGGLPAAFPSYCKIDDGK